MSVMHHSRTITVCVIRDSRHTVRLKQPLVPLQATSRIEQFHISRFTYVLVETDALVHDGLISQSGPSTLDEVTKPVQTSAF